MKKTVSAVSLAALLILSGCGFSKTTEVETSTGVTAPAPATPAEKSAEYNQKAQESLIKLQQKLEEQKTIAPQSSLLQWMIPLAHAEEEVAADTSVTTEAVAETASAEVATTSEQTIEELMTEVQLYTELAAEAAAEITDPAEAATALEAVGETQQEAVETIEPIAETSSEAAAVVEDLSATNEQISAAVTVAEEAVASGETSVALEVETAVDEMGGEAAFAAQMPVRIDRPMIKEKKKARIEQRIADITVRLQANGATPEEIAAITEPMKAAVEKGNLGELLRAGKDLMRADQIARGPKLVPEMVDARLQEMLATTSGSMTPEMQKFFDEAKADIAAGKLVGAMEKLHEVRQEVRHEERQEQFEERKAIRDEEKKEKLELRAKLQSGEITPEVFAEQVKAQQEERRAELKKEVDENAGKRHEARAEFEKKALEAVAAKDPARAEDLKKQFEARKEVQKEVRENREEMKEMRQENRQEVKELRKENGQEVRGQMREDRQEIKAMTASGATREEVKAKVEENREEMKEMRQENRQEVKGKMQENREEVKTQAQENRQEVKEMRQESRPAAQQPVRQPQGGVQPAGVPQPNTPKPPLPPLPPVPAPQQ